MLVFNLIITFIVVRCENLIQPLKVILHYDYGSVSHIKPLLEIGKVLQNRNHTVIYSAASNKELYNAPYQFRFASLGKTFDDPTWMRKTLKEMFGKRKEVSGDEIFSTFVKILPTSYDTVYPRLSRVVELEKPDVIVCDFFSPACRDVADMKGIPLVMGFQTVDGFGLERSPLVTNTLGYVGITTDALTFLQRLVDKALIPLLTQYKTRPLLKALNEVRIKYNVPEASLPLGDFSSGLGLANTFVGFEAASPLQPNIRMVGPIQSESSHTLNEELLTFLKDHPRTLYIAFGSVVILSEFDIQNLVFGSQLAIQEGTIDGVIWGLGSTTREDFPDLLVYNQTQLNTDHLFNNLNPNFRILTWAPQVAILNHINTKLFIFHGGLDSAFEAIFSATPVLAMPFFSDQPRNARKLEDAGIGRYIDRINTTPNQIATKIKLLIMDKDGKVGIDLKRMQTLAQIGSKRKALGADAIEEYAQAARICRPHQLPRYGDVPCEAKHLIPVSREMSYIQANLLDVYCVTGVGLILSFYLLVILSWKLFVFIFRHSQGISEKRKLQ